MKVVTIPHGWYPDDINSRLDFDEFSSKSEESILFVGISCTEQIDPIHLAMNTKYSAYVNLEHPCTLYGPNNSLGLDPISQQMMYNQVYTICPYTADWLNSIQSNTKFIPMPYPHNLKYDIYEEERIKKVYDVAYCGLIHSDEIASYIRAISPYKYFFSTIKEYNRNKTVNNLATHDNIPNTKKWDVLSTSRASIIQNNLYLNAEQIKIVKNLPRWNENKAFSHIDTGLLPQLKSRTVEAAICKSLMIVKKDPWNVIEHWFEPGKDFIYFEDPLDLSEKVKDIKANWEKYIPMIENAYQKVKTTYNTKHIFEQIKNRKEII